MQWPHGLTHLVGAHLQPLMHSTLACPMRLHERRCTRVTVTRSSGPAPGRMVLRVIRRDVPGTRDTQPGLRLRSVPGAQSSCVANRQECKQ